MTELIKKLKFKSAECIILDADPDFDKVFETLQFSTQFNKKVKSENTLAFMLDYKILINFLQKQLKYIKYDGVFWIAFPKGTGLIKTDINRDIIGESLPQFGLKTVTAISLNNTWSALRVRPKEMVGK